MCYVCNFDCLIFNCLYRKETEMKSTKNADLANYGKQILGLHNAF